ncbi:MAG: hypothetical protein M1372_02150 [Patescibacteria group bacterium]|nr:hypothetical protein [Patescibacteria group bacterium]
MKSIETRTQFNSEGLTPIKSELTPQPNPPTLEKRGDIFMPEPGQTEAGTGRADARSRTLKKHAPENPLTRQVDRVQNQELRAFATDFQSRVEKAPLSEWSTEDLSSEYLRLQALTARLASTGDFSQRERVSADAAPLSRAIIEQLEKKGVDLKELFLKSAEQAGKAGISIRSIGAATLTPADFPDPILQHIVSELNAEVGRVGIGSLIDIRYAHEQRLRVRDLLDQGLVNPDQANNLINELNKWIAESAREQHGDTLSTLLEDVRNSPEGDREEKMMQILRGISPHTNGLPPELVIEVIKLDGALDYLVNRIIAQPLDAETSDYRLSFYGGINLEQIKDILKAEGQKDSAMQERYQKVLFVSEAVSLFHNMNLLIVTGNLEGFVNGSRGITPQQLQALQNVRGVSSVMRIFNEEFQRILSRDKYINDANYDEIMGSRGVATERNPRKPGTVEKRFQDLINNKVEEPMEEWEVKWAVNSGKLLFNLTLRAAEQISLGEVQKGDEQWGSIPQESAARLMNWMGWTGFRFMISESRGGMVLARMAQDNFQRERGEYGYSDISIETLGGKKIEDFELSSMSGVSGIWSSWRQNLIILKNLKVEIDNFRGSTFSGNLRDFIKQAGEKNPEGLREVYLEKDSAGNYTLRKEINTALGILLKHGSITPVETDSAEMRKAKEDVRIAIWKRVAEDNPLAVAPLLHNTKLKGKEALFLSDDGTKDGETKVWDSLTEKLSTLHEIRMQRIKNGQPISLSDLITEQDAQERGIKLDTNEKKLLEHIRTTGQNFAGEFANVRFAFNPFMNDVLFENINYAEAGAQFYGRRVGSDLPSHNNTYNEFVKLMDNPGGTSLEDALKVLHGMVQAMGTPQGIEFGQDRILPFLEAYIRFTEEGGQNTGVLRWLEKDAIWSGIRKLTRAPNSLAQQFSGPEGLGLNELDMRRALDTAHHMGILRSERHKDGELLWTDTYEKMRKKFRLQLGWLLAGLLRDIIPLFAAGALFEFGQKATKEK